MILHRILLLTALASGGHQTPKWHTVTIVPRVTVSLPESAVPIPDPAGTVTNGKLLVFTDDKGSFEAGVIGPTTDADKQQAPEEALADYVAGELHSLGAAVVRRQRDIVYHGWPGLELVIVNDQAMAVYGRCYLIDGKLYIVERGYHPSSGRPTDSDQFVGSLAVAPCPEGPLKVPGPVFTTYTSTEGGFQVGMPGKVESHQEQVGTEALRATCFECTAGYGNRIYGAAYAIFASDAPLDRIRDGFETGLLGGLRAKVQKKDMVTRDGRQYSSISFTMSNGEAGGRLDTTQEGHRVISIMMAYPLGHGGSPDIDAFFNSLKVLPK